MSFHRIKKALILSAFFIVSFFSFSASQAQTTASCPEFVAGESAQVRYIHDGDTLFLSDDRKVRLIGIDTPELARKQKQPFLPAQPFAEAARDYARELIQRYGRQVQLMPGIEKTDRYQRSLFHIQLSDGSLLQSRLIRAGFAIAYTTPPNQHLSHCYQADEKFARRQQKNIWSRPKYQVTKISKLNPSSKGFHIVRGTVRHIGESKKAYWLNFNGDFSARIDKRNLQYFSYPLSDLLEKDIIVRGWLRHYKNKTQMSVKHPSAIQLQTP